MKVIIIVSSLLFLLNQSSEDIRKKSAEIVFPNGSTGEYLDSLNVLLNEVG